MRDISPLKFFEKDEQFFLLHVRPESLTGFLIDVDIDKKITPKKIWHETNWTDLQSRFHRGRFARHVIISAESSLTYSALVPVRILRESALLPIHATELENILAQEVGKMFNRCRVEASKELGVDDLDVILAHSRVGEFKVDGHRVLNPIGLKAERIEAVLELMLTTRDLLTNLKSFLRGREEYFFTETARAELLALSRIEKMPVRLLRLASPASAYLEMKDAIVGHEVVRTGVGWDAEELLHVIRAEWGVSHPAAIELYRSYLRGTMAPSGELLFRKILAAATEPLWKEAQRLKLHGKVYVDASVPLPVELPAKKGRAEFIPPPVDELIAHSGFSYHAEEWPLPPERLFRTVAPFLAYYHDRSDSTVNRWLRRHLNWLGSPAGVS